MSQVIFVAAGTVASVALIVLAFSVRRPRIVACNVVIHGCTLIQYFIAGATAGAAMSLIALSYAVVMTQAERLKALNERWVLYLVLVLYVLTYALVNRGNLASPELLVLYGALTSIFAMTLKTQQVTVKILQMSGNIAYTTFSLIIGAYAQLPGQLVCLTVLCLSLVYVIRMRKQGVQYVPEFTETVRKNFNRGISGKKTAR